MLCVPAEGLRPGDIPAGGSMTRVQPQHVITVPGGCWRPPTPLLTRLFAVQLPADCTGCQLSAKAVSKLCIHLFVYGLLHK